MIDREKVLKGLKCHVYGNPQTRCRKCPYWGTGPHGSSECNVLAADALALLIEREPNLEAVEPRLGGVNLWLCGNCGEVIAWDELTQSGLDMVEFKYCPNCGRKVKWDAVD